jgi:hypothetical protein
MYQQKKSRLVLIAFPAVSNELLPDHYLFFSNEKEKVLGAARPKRGKSFRRSRCPRNGQHKKEKANRHRLLPLHQTIHNYLPPTASIGHQSSALHDIDISSTQPPTCIPPFAPAPAIKLPASLAVRSLVRKGAEWILLGLGTGALTLLLHLSGF